MYWCELALATLAAFAPGCVRHVSVGAATLDAATLDAATPDAATPDAATPDAATPDAATPDASQAGSTTGGYATARPIAGRSIGNTSVVFRLKLEGGLEAVYKPRSRRGDLRYRGEIAAHRLALALGIANVPEALARAFDAAELRAALIPDARALFDSEAVVEGGRVRGALIPWIASYEVLPLETAEWRARWRKWLMRGEPMPNGEDRALAGQIAAMIVFDYVTANWDRWSGANVAVNRATRAVLYVDNDGAFYEPPPPGPTEAQRRLVETAWRFPRRFMRALEALDAQGLARATGEESPDVPLLSREALASLEARRARAVAIVAAKVKVAGEAEVLAFE